MKYAAVPVTRPSTSRSTRTKAPNEYLAEIDSLIAGEHEALKITVPGGTQLVRASQDGYNADAASAKRQIQTAARAKKYTAETAVEANEDNSLTLTFWVKPRSASDAGIDGDAAPAGDGAAPTSDAYGEVVGEAEVDRRELAETPAHDAEPAHATAEVEDDGAELLVTDVPADVETGRKGKRGVKDFVFG